ncbi:MAG: TVP38/TMEM64 family protein, partial [Pirellulaceae bacterium]
ALTGSESSTDTSRNSPFGLRFGHWLQYLGFGLIILIIVVIFGRAIAGHINDIESWIQSISPWGVFVFIGLVALLTSLLVPSTLLSIAAGSLFGLVGGLSVVVAGTLFGSALQYFLARTLFRKPIERSIAAKPSLKAIQQAVQQRELRLQLLLRMTPLNAASTSYLLGAAGVPFFGFFLACLALIPGLFLQVYFGYAGEHIAKAATRDDGTIGMHDIVIVVGLVVSIVVVTLVARTAHRIVKQAMAEADADGS